jgi:hypothetical protein
LLFCFLILLDALDGKYWTEPSKTPRPIRQRGNVQPKGFADQKIITRLANLIAFTNRMRCSDPECTGTLQFNGYMPNAFCLKATCPVCDCQERIHTTRFFTLSHSDKQRQLPDVPYIMAVATRLLPGGGAATQARLNTILGLATLGHTTLNSFYQGPFLAALKAVYEKSIQDNLEPVICHSRTIDPAADGVNKFYPVTMRVDARWDKSWGWNALNSTIRMIEATTDLVMATVTLHRKDSSENKFELSAKACDAEGSALCLIELTKRGFDIVEVVHDNDASTMKKLRATKAELAKKPEYIGKISATVRETLCTRCAFCSVVLFFLLIFSYCIVSYSAFLDFFGFLIVALVLILRHGGKHVGDAINTMAEEAMKLLKKNKPTEPGTLTKPTLAEKREYNNKMKKFHSDRKSYEEAMLELKVLSSNKAYNYFKKSWKVALREADGDLEEATELIENVSTHLDHNEPCVDCAWHEIGDEYVQSFGPFRSQEAMSVINLWCEKYADEESLRTYINNETTNYNEYVNSLEGFLNPKIKHVSDASYDGFAIYSSTLANIGPVAEKQVMQELGLPWEEMQDLLLKQRIAAHEYNSERKKSEPYLTGRAKQKQKRKEDTGDGRKDGSYKSVAIAKENDKNYKRAVNAQLPLLYALDSKSTKRKKTGSFSPGQLTFVKFGQMWYFGIVMSETETTYDVYFHDTDSKTLPHSELKAESFLQASFPIWIPNNLRAKGSQNETVTYSDFKVHMDVFTKKLSDYYSKRVNTNG